MSGTSMSKRQGFADALAMLANGQASTLVGFGAVATFGRAGLSEADDMKKVRKTPIPGTPRLLAVAMFMIAVSASGCTAEARNDAATSLFVKAVNLKCKMAKSEARLAWSIGDELGAGAQAVELQAAAAEHTDNLLAQIDRLNGPADIRQQVSELFAKSSSVVTGVLNGRISADEGKAKLNNLRQQARDKGLGECVSR